MDYISIKNLEVISRQTNLYDELSIGQKFAIDARLYIDTRTAGVNEDISKSVDYGAVCHFMSAFMKGHSYKLIESAAERLAEDVLIEYPAISRIALTVKKPWAPVGLPLEEVSVTIERGWHKAFLSLGSNMGDREAYIKNAKNVLAANDRISIVKESGIIETEPYGMKNQDRFLNAAIEIRTLHTPIELLTFCKNLEKMAGRVETEKRWGPRPLDLDILFYDNDIIDLPTLTVPHIDLQNRLFVLEPMCEIAPYHRHPVYMKTIAEMLAELQ